MPSKSTSPKYVGVIGAGSFGTVVANLIAHNADVLLYEPEHTKVATMQQTRTASGHPLASNIIPTCDLQEVAISCKVLFPIVPAKSFRPMIQKLAPWLRPHHMLIHGTKGLDVQWPLGKDTGAFPLLTRDTVKTMSEVIQAESVVYQVGCLAGPNLAGELAQGQPAATVVASTQKEVLLQGQQLLRNDHFQVYLNQDLLGVELCGALKNIMAIGAGCLSGLGYGGNTRSLLISRGMLEMAHIGQTMGASIQPFIGLAGIGDLIASCTNNLSRNYTLGYRLAQGTALRQLMQGQKTTIEGIHTVKIIHSLIKHYNVRAPITQLIYRILFENLAVREAMQTFIQYPATHLDVDLRDIT